MPCERAHSDDTLEAVVALEDSQAGAQRHKCAACAYEAGLVAGRVAGIAAVLVRLAESFGPFGTEALREAADLLNDQRHRGG